jgi:hypothetical protein
MKIKLKLPFLFKCQHMSLVLEQFYFGYEPHQLKTMSRRTSLPVEPGSEQSREFFLSYVISADDQEYINPAENNWIISRVMTPPHSPERFNYFVLCALRTSELSSWICTTQDMIPLVYLF